MRCYFGVTGCVSPLVEVSISFISHFTSIENIRIMRQFSLFARFLTELEKTCGEVSRQILIFPELLAE